MDRKGTYICEREGNGVRVDANGIMSTFAGTGERGYSGDGGPALAATSKPKAIRCDHHDNIIVVDTENNAIRRIDAVTGIVTTIAGGHQGGDGDGGPATAAGLEQPHGCGIDPRGNLYIADGINHCARGRYDEVLRVCCASWEGTLCITDRASLTASATFGHSESWRRVVTLASYGQPNCAPTARAMAASEASAKRRCSTGYRIPQPDQPVARSENANRSYRTVSSLCHSMLAVPPRPHALAGWPAKPTRCTGLISSST